jgi:alanyl-tRNA synthetase
MTDRLYYHDSFLYDFEAEVREVLDSPRPALILDRTAFYPTSGGQIFDTGWITSDANQKLKVTEVADTEDGKVVHYLEARKDLQPGTRVRGQIDAARRRDHMQQHSGQHVLSAAFIRLHNLPTVSFHMADDYCSIDLDTPTLTKEQIESAERLANDIILENRAVDIRFVTREEAGKLGLRKLPADGTRRAAHHRHSRLGRQRLRRHARRAHRADCRHLIEKDGESPSGMARRIRRRAARRRDRPPRLHHSHRNRRAVLRAHL